MRSMSKIVDVVAGTLIAADGRFLLGSRPEGKPYAGYWEFPGGKIEPGETPFEALRREFHEELGIDVKAATPWLTKVHVYEHATVRLRFYRVWNWTGEFEMREGQTIAWQVPGELTVGPMLPANGAILKALELPAVLAITCAHEIGEEVILARLAEAPPAAVLVREPGYQMEELARFVREVSARVRPAGGKVFANADPAWLEGLPIDGVHLSEARLMAMDARPDFEWVGASVHGREAKEKAEALGADYLLLGHVKPTPTHPDSAPLGWDGFECRLAEGCPLPVYALGGLSSADLADAYAHGAQGVALMRGAWR
ncbi:Nudix family hydrolase [Crenobacter cavernae]|uniref:8-oxo-dGTP diphosphatase n=2 Tax=Crenobacter cavernae TaxID=2290923 RepID=A0A345Y306_9NEIS|nr:Nudix family hydrolase [Crenobacter cavernae]